MKTPRPKPSDGGGFTKNKKEIAKHNMIFWFFFSIHLIFLAMIFVVLFQ